MLKILVTICARGGSKGILKKNIKNLNNKPLISYTIGHAFDFSKSYDSIDIALSTDDNEIKKISSKYGLKTSYTRPHELSGDDVGKIVVIKDLLKYYENLNKIKYDIILDLDVSSPLRTQENLQLALKKLLDNKNAINLFSVSEARRNPYFNVVELNDEGYSQLVKKSFAKTRQSSPEVFDMNASFYFYKRVFFEKNYKSAITNKSLHYLMNHTCFDLDEPLDFQIMEFLISKNKLEIKI